MGDTAHQRFAARARRAPSGVEPGVVRVQLLGGFEVSVGPRTVERGGWRLRKAASLVKMLALTEGRALHRERLTAALWPDLDARRAANNLHRALHFARRTLGGDPADTASRYLRLEGHRVVLCPDAPLWVDVAAFEEAAATARRVREPGAYRVAIELYSGELLPEDLYEPWTEERREELRRSYLALLVELARLHEERREHDPAIEALRRVVAEDPASQEAHAELMRLYALRGQHHESVLQYERLQKALREKLDREPDDAIQSLYQEIRAGSFPAVPLRRATDRAPREHAPRDNLPAALTSFVGREKEMMEVRRLLSMTRLLMLTGAGGSGKTRLALEVARSLAGVYPDGVWLAELAPFSDPALVPQAVARAVGAREQPGRPLPETLVEHLRARDLLLVLDNCEHLVEAAAHLAEALLRACPGLRVLATSREPLGVRGEVVWPVPPLSLPDANRTFPVEGLMGDEAIRLFVDRARSRLPGFGLTEENAAAAVRVCRGLDGMPLAIELATARMGALTVEQIAERLENSLGLLSAGGRTSEPRHRTLRATLDWSHGLLSRPEKELFGRLPVFAGGWTLEAAEGVCSGGDIDPDEVLDLLSGLVEKSLVVAGAGRHRMLEPVRQYAWEKLEESGQTESLRARHAGYYLGLAERVQPELMGPEPAPWLAMLEREVGNLRAALSWALDEDSGDERIEVGLRLATALARFWDTHGPAESRRWLEKGLARGVEVPPAVRAEVLREAGFIAVYEWDPRSIEMLYEAFETYRELGDRAGTLLAVEHLGHALAHHATPETAAPIVAEVGALLGDSGDRHIQARLMTFLGFAAEVESDHEETRRRWKEALAIYREVGDAWNISRCLPSLGMITLACHDVEEAAGYFEEGLAMERDIRYKTIIFFHLMGLSAVATHRGHLRRAAKLYGATEKLRESEGFSLSALASSEYAYEGYVAAVRSGLDDAAFGATWNEGRALSLEEAIEYALSAEDTLAPAGDRAEALDLLTRREQQVALLIGRGYTNREIARELAINERTVETHVSKILRKLKSRSRTQIATRIIHRGPTTAE